MQLPRLFQLGCLSCKVVERSFAADCGQVQLKVSSGDSAQEGIYLRTGTTVGHNKLFEKCMTCTKCQHPALHMQHPRSSWGSLVIREHLACLWNEITISIPDPV